MQAHDASGELWRIAGDPFNDDERGHCSLAGLCVSGAELWTLDINCDRLRRYAVATGAYLGAYTGPPASWSALACGAGVWVLGQGPGAALQQIARP